MERSRNPPRTQLMPAHPLKLSTHLLLCWTHPTPKCLFSLKNLQEPPKWPSLRTYSPTIHFLHSNQSDLLRKMGHTISLLQSFPELPTKFRIQPKFLTWLTQALYDLAPPIYLTYLLPVSLSLSLCCNHTGLFHVYQMHQGHPHFRTFPSVIPTFWKVLHPDLWMTGFFLTIQISMSLLQPGHLTSAHLK